MPELTEPDPLASAEPPFLDLFMTVIRVADWSNIVRWYTDTLGLVVVLLDPQHEFAFLAAGQSRLGLQGVKGAREPTVPSKVRLVFQVRDLDNERRRLVELGLEVSVPFDNREEGYREIRLHDPDGNSLTLFAWIDSARARGLSSNGQRRPGNGESGARDGGIEGVSDRPTMG
jgi:catechol 2,3-dioxygenase-like lactoylglutathione lyase family enzyme